MTFVGCMIGHFAINCSLECRDGLVYWRLIAGFREFHSWARGNREHLRLDELRQFWNVLRGDMAIRLRPECQEFVDVLVAQIPCYG